MANMVPRAFALLLVALGTCAGHLFHIHNNCNHDVWLGLLGNGKGVPTIPDIDGSYLPQGESLSTYVPKYWSGRVWGRTDCDYGYCQTGGCVHGNACNDVDWLPPATFANITLDTGPSNTLDFYNVNLLWGYNLPIYIQPVDGIRVDNDAVNDCFMAGCDLDLNRFCPSELQVKVSDVVVGCKSACLAFNREYYCCLSNIYDQSSTCPSSCQSNAFEAACPDAYGYAYDDQMSMYTCNGIYIGSSEYNIDFCRFGGA